VILKKCMPTPINLANLSDQIPDIDRSMFLGFDLASLVKNGLSFSETQPLIKQNEKTFSSFLKPKPPKVLDYPILHSSILPKTTFPDKHKVFFDELEENPSCINSVLIDLQKQKEINLNFVETIELSIDIANRKFLEKIDSRNSKQKDSPNYNYFTNLLFEDESQKYISVGFNIDYSAGYFKDDNFFFYDKKAEKQVTTYGIQFFDEFDGYSEKEKLLVEYRNQELKNTRLNKGIIDWLETKPILKNYVRGKKTLAKNGGVIGFEFKLFLYLEDMEQPIKLDKDDKPLVGEFEFKLDDKISTLFVNNRPVKFPKKRSQQYKIVKYIFQDRLKTDYLNPKMIITFLRTQKLIDNEAYTVENLRDAINRLNTKIKQNSDLTDNFLIFDGGKISINKTIKMI
jgi:hypothetical protein